MSQLEMLVPDVSDITFKYTWTLEKYPKQTQTKAIFDSLPFEINVNGIKTRWSLSVRFWTGRGGTQLTNPVVVCLNMLRCQIDTPEEVGLKYQLGIFNQKVQQVEVCGVSHCNLNLHNTNVIQSIGYKNITVLERHMNKKGDIQLSCKLVILRNNLDQNTLSYDLHQLLSTEDYSDTILRAQGKEFRVHRNILSARSPVFAAMFAHDMQESILNKVEIADMTPDNLHKMLQYIYTDKVENLDSLAHILLAAAEKYQLNGLKDMCERNLIDILTPANVAALLLLADRFNCEALRKATLAYCEANVNKIVKTVAWKVMEKVNPSLFHEVCEAVINDSNGVKTVNGNVNCNSGT